MCTRDEIALYRYTNDKYHNVRSRTEQAQFLQSTLPLYDSKHLHRLQIVDNLMDHDHVHYHHIIITFTISLSHHHQFLLSSSSQYILLKYHNTRWNEFTNHNVVHHAHHVVYCQQHTRSDRLGHKYGTNSWRPVFNRSDWNMLV